MDQTCSISYKKIELLLGKSMFDFCLMLVV